MLPDLPSLVCVQSLHLTLDVVESTKQLECFASNLAAVIGPKFMEFTSGMRHAASFGHAQLEQRFVAAIVVIHKCPAPVAKEMVRMATGPAVGEVEDDRL